MRPLASACRRARTVTWSPAGATAGRVRGAARWTGQDEHIHTNTRSSTYRAFHHASRREHWEPTIYALSSAPGRAAIAVIRVSGPACLGIYDALCPGSKPLKPRVAAMRSLYQPGLPANRETVIDSSALLLYFQAPATVTGEDVLELHVHGGPAVVRAVLAAIADSTKDIRYAEAGEFTRRAFMNDRLDLTQVEALGDTLSADTEQQRRLSVRGTTGGLAKQYEQWRQQLLYARGELEALIDFSEDQHFDESPAELCESVAKQVGALRRTLRTHSQNAVRGELLRHGISISLLGAPNAGKSSLLNRIVGREAAIVSSEAGTTRDIVEIGVDLGGYFCRFGDTAGLREARRAAAASGRDTQQQVINKIEIEGMRRAKARAAESDLIIVVLSFERSKSRGMLNLDAEVCNVARHFLSNNPEKVIFVINKSDIFADDESVRERGMQSLLQEFPALGRDSVHLISCRTAEDSERENDDNHHHDHEESISVPSDSLGMQSSDPGGIQALLRGLIRRFGTLTAALTLDEEDSPAAVADPSVWQESLGASERHRGLLDACVSHLDAFLTEVNTASVSQRGFNDVLVGGTDDVRWGHQQETDIVVAAEHLRYAADCLAKITGKGESGDVEEVLGVVFEKFCVGK